MKRLKLHLRIAKLRLERWAIARLWSGNWVDREDALEDVDAEIRELRFRLRAPDGFVFRSRQGDVADTAAAMLPDDDDAEDERQRSQRDRTRGDR